MAQEPIPYDVFVEIWQSSESVKEVVEKTARSKATVEDMAHRLRKAGVKLKTMRKTPVRSEMLDEDLVAKLNAKIEAAG